MISGISDDSIGFVSLAKEHALPLRLLDEATELRSVILCVDQDNLQPAIRDLRTVAGERPDGEGQKVGPAA